MPLLLHTVAATAPGGTCSECGAALPLPHRCSGDAFAARITCHLVEAVCEWLLPGSTLLPAQANMALALAELWGEPAP